MPTHAALAVTLLKDAATFFRNMAASNPDIKSQMTQNALAFEQMADALGRQPEGKAGNLSYAGLTAELLKNAAIFFRSIAEQNEPIKEQMMRSADIYDQMAALVSQNPLGVLD